MANASKPVQKAITDREVAAGRRVVLPADGVATGSGAHSLCALSSNKFSSVQLPTSDILTSSLC